MQTRNPIGRQSGNPPTLKNRSLVQDNPIASNKLSKSNLVQLQRLIGNQGVQRLIAREKFNNESSLSPNLSISHQAEHTKERSALQRCSCGGSCAKCQAAEAMDEPIVGAPLQRAISIQRFWGDDEEGSGGGILDTASNLVSDAASTVTDLAGNAASTVTNAASDAGQWVSDTASGAADWVGNTASAAGDAVSSTAGAVWNGVTDAAGAVGDAVSDTAGAAANTVSDMTGAGGESVSSILDSVNADALVAQAADQVVADTQGPKLPRVQQAEALIAKSDGYLKGNAPDGIDLDLPAPPSGANPNECCPEPTLQATRAAMDSPKTDLESTLRAFKTAQHNTKIAADDAKITCLSTVISLLVPGIGLKPGPGIKPTLQPGMGPFRGPLSKGGGIGGGSLVGAAVGVAAAFAACIACIKAATPVKAAIEAEGKAYDDLIPAMDKLGKAISSYETCYAGSKNCTPANGSNGSVIDLGDL